MLLMLKEEELQTIQTNGKILLEQLVLIRQGLLMLKLKRVLINTLTLVRSVVDRVVLVADQKGLVHVDHVATELMTQNLN